MYSFYEAARIFSYLNDLLYGLRKILSKKNAKTNNKVIPTKGNRNQHISYWFKQTLNKKKSKFLTFLKHHPTNVTFWTKRFSQIPKKPFTAGGSMLSLFLQFCCPKIKKKSASLTYKNKKICTTDTRF